MKTIYHIILDAKLLPCYETPADVFDLHTNASNLKISDVVLLVLKTYV